MYTYMCVCVREQDLAYKYWCAVKYQPTYNFKWYLYFYFFSAMTLR